jgi:hypothetical protein
MTGQPKWPEEPDQPERPGESLYPSQLVADHRDPRFPALDQKCRIIDWPGDYCCRSRRVL